MLNEQEEAFVRQWSEQRKHRNRYLRRLSLGLPLGTLLAGGLIALLLSGWHQRAGMVLRGYSSLYIMILIALAGTVTFVVVFSARHQWEQREQQYHELMARKDRHAANNEPNTSQ